MAQRIDFALTPQQRADAREALRILDGTGVTLAEAARRAVHGQRALRRVKVAVAVDEFVRSRLTGDCRARTVEWYENKLRPVTAKFGDVMLDDVDRPTFHAWIKALPGTPGTRAGVVRAARALWNWGIAHEPQLVAVDITIGLKGTGPRGNGEAEYFAVEEVERIMRHAGPYRSALALLLFAGVRPEELAGRSKPPMLWRHVNIEERAIRVPAEIAKTGKPRIMENLPETVWRWLEPRDAEAPVCPARTRQATERAQAALARKDWPHDVTRHTFGTYALAFTQDPGKVAMWMGHEGNPTMLHNHYRGLATRVQAERFWALAP